MTWAGLYVFSLVLSTSGAWAVSRYAEKIGLVDCPNGRSSHCMPTPKGGGIGIFFVFLISAIVSGIPVGISVLAMRPFGPAAVLIVLAGWFLAFGVESCRVQKQTEKNRPQIGAD